MIARSIRQMATWLLFATVVGASLLSQTNPSERTFPQSKAAVEKALQAIQGNMAGRLPVLDGFANSSDSRSLDHYQRGYYQAKSEVTSTAGVTVVRITTKVTAWYSDPAKAHSGYQLLKSNGRLEADLLDQLAEQLAKTSPEKASDAAASKSTESSTASKSAAISTSGPATPSPQLKFPETDRTFSSSLKHGLAAEHDAKSTPESASGKNLSPVQAEIASLQEVLKNTVHPKNLVAVKKSGTPVVDKPSLTSKPQFLASQYDEFELLDFNADWVHVRISGLSRGWIWRNSVEMPEGIAETTTRAAASLTPAADLFHISREEVAPFPGDWLPLRSKAVKIISVQKANQNVRNSGPRERLEFTKYLLDKSFAELVKKPGGLDGIVVIFDSADGGMVAATTATLQDWKSGKLSDAGLWHQCFFDPPETFDSTSSSTEGTGSAAPQ